jgi:predicted HicB family RNase H-like nuclease
MKKPKAKVPRKEASMVKAASMLIRLTEEQKATYTAAAAREEMELSQWVRMVCTRAAKATGG